MKESRLSPNNVDVLIVGAGPVGLFCANELKRHGLTCRIIDKKPQLSDKSKALGIHIRTLDVLEDCGLLDEVLQQGHRVEGVLFKSHGKTLVNATFAGIEANWHFLIDLPQSKTEAVLNQGLNDKGMQVDWETELTQVTQYPTEITATLKKPNNKIELYSANWLIACDGAHSTLRHQVGAEFKGSAYPQEWWLADLHLDWDVPDNRMAVYVTNKGPLACFPMGNKRYRVVMVAPKNSTGDPSFDEVVKEFNQRCSDAATLSNPVWLSQFTIHHRQIQHYRYDRIFFAGDAAHIHSPMGGQGLNTGIQDIYNLVWKLALVEKRKAQPELLDSYHEERFPVGQEVLKKTDLMTRMMLLSNPLAIMLRNKLLHFLTSFNSIKHFMIKDIAELAISYAKSPIVHENGTIKKLKAGVFLPTFELVNPLTDTATNSLAITQGVVHHLFIFKGLKEQKNSSVINMANELAQKYASMLKVHLIIPGKTNNSPGVFSVWLDENKQLHKQFNFKKPALILVRPDKYIGISQKSINEKKLKEQLYLL